MLLVSIFLFIPALILLYSPPAWTQEKDVLRPDDFPVRQAELNKLILKKTVNESIENIMINLYNLKKISRADTGPDG